MKVLQVAVSTAGYRDWQSNSARLGILSMLLAQAKQRSCDLVLLPSGFLQAPKGLDVLALRDEVVRLVANAGDVGVVLGIDAGHIRKSSLHSVVKRGGLLPYWGLAVEPGGATLHFWQQQTFLSSQATANNAIDVAERTIDVHGAKVLVLLCGEMFNRHMRAQLAGHGFGLVVIAGHDGLGMGLIPTLRALVQNAGCPAIHSQHLASTTGSLHMVDASGRQISAKVGRHMLVTASGVPWVSAVERIV